MTQFDRNQADAFLKIIDPGAAGFTFQTFDDSPHKRPELAHVFHASIDGAWGDLFRCHSVAPGYSSVSMRRILGAVRQATSSESVRYSRIWMALLLRIRGTSRSSPAGSPAPARGGITCFGVLPTSPSRNLREAAVNSRDACAAILPPPAAPAPVERHLVGPGNGAGTERRYALAALQSEACYVETARPGDRNNTLNKAAFCGTLIPAGEISASEVEEVLTSAALKAGLHPNEIATTLGSGIRAGVNQPRRIGGTG